MGYAFKKRLKGLNRSRANVHSDPDRSLFLDRNEMPILHEPAVLRSLHRELARVRLNLYPDLELFYDKLAKWLKVDRARIFVTEGVSGAVKSLVETLAGPGSNIVFPVPTFALYPVYCRMFGLEYRTAGYTRNYSLDTDGLLRLVDKETSIVFLPNPNVPIEGTLSLKAVRDIAGYCARKNVLLALDEVYYPFGGPTAVSLIDDFDNVVVMRSFSKAFGLAGVRVGYMLGPKKIVDYVSKIRTGYETNSVSAAIVSFFIDNYSFVARHIKYIKEGREYIKREFDKRRIEYNGGRASNFIFVNLRDRDNADGVVGELKAKNIYIRGGWPEPYSGGFSVTCGPKYLMKRFLKELFGALDNYRYGR